MLSSRERKEQEDAMIGSILEECDRDGDGSLSFEEFWRWRERYVFLERRQKMLRAIVHNNVIAGATRKEQSRCVVS